MLSDIETQKALAALKSYRDSIPAGIRIPDRHWLTCWELCLDVHKKNLSDCNQSREAARQSALMLQGQIEAVSNSLTLSRLAIERAAKLISASYFVTTDKELKNLHEKILHHLETLNQL